MKGIEYFGSSLCPPDAYYYAMSGNNGFVDLALDCLSGFEIYDDIKHIVEIGSGPGNSIEPLLDRFEVERVLFLWTYPQRCSHTPTI